MLRVLVGLPVLVLAAILALRALGDSGSFVDDERSLLEQLLQPQEPAASGNERLRLEDESRQRLEQNTLNIERMLVEKRASLAEVGPTFEISAFGGGLTGSHLSMACLIGETGKVYMYDVRRDAGAQMTSVVDEGEFSRAASLAKSLGHVEWRPQRVVYDFGVSAWTMSFNGKTTLLQVAGDYGGALPDPRASELVKLIDGWCPHAQEIRSRSEFISR